MLCLRPERLCTLHHQISTSLSLPPGKEREKKARKRERELDKDFTKGVPNEKSVPSIFTACTDQASSGLNIEDGGLNKRGQEAVISSASAAARPAHCMQPHASQTCHAHASARSWPRPRQIIVQRGNKKTWTPYSVIGRPPSQET